MNPKYSSLKALNWKKLDIAVKTRTKQKLLRERYGTKRKNLKSKKEAFPQLSKFEQQGDSISFCRAKHLKDT